jgi:hypothetical protein
MAWCSVKAQGQLYLYFTLLYFTLLYFRDITWLRSMHPIAISVQSRGSYPVRPTTDSGITESPNTVSDEHHINKYSMQQTHTFFPLHKRNNCPFETCFYIYIYICLHIYKNIHKPFCTVVIHVVEISLELYLFENFSKDKIRLLYTYRQTDRDAEWLIYTAKLSGAVFVLNSLCGMLILVCTQVSLGRAIASNF